MVRGCGGGFPSRPELYSRVYDPIWATCAELGVPVNHHAGSASPPLGEEPAARAVFMVETTWFSHRALWHLVFGGAFRRYPGLRLVLTEQGAAPSQVWRENCFVGAGFMRPHEVPLRDRIGVDRIMWSSDHPHDEGTHPYTREALRFAYAGVPREEAAAMLGGNVRDEVRRTGPAAGKVPSSVL